MGLKDFKPVPQDIVELRRDLHLHPELSCKEERTSGIVAAELERLGYKVVTDRSAGFSLLGVMEFDRAGKTLALRADMDALPIQENACNLVTDKKFVSQNDGVAHMCGHDFHTAGLLAAARHVAEHRGDFKGRVIFCFESGEEIGAGWDAINLLKAQGNIDALFAIHIHANYPVGTVAVSDGACTAGCETFRVKVVGKSVHGATPHLGIDPVNCAAQIITSSNSVVARRVDARQAAVLSVCSVHAGTSWNRVPDDAEILGGLRFFSMETGRQMHELFESLAKGTAEANGCTAEVAWSNLAPPIVNDPDLARLARDCAAATGAENVPCDPWMASETFARYREIAPEVMAFTGCADEASGCGAPQHSDKFDADERVLSVNAALLAEFIGRFLG